MLKGEVFIPIIFHYVSYERGVLIWMKKIQ